MKKKTHKTHFIVQQHLRNSVFEGVLRRLSSQKATNGVFKLLSKKVFPKEKDKSSDNIGGTAVSTMNSTLGL